jgi:hypothetical protein
MADERIEVEYIAQQQQIVSLIDKLNKKFERQEKQLQKTADTSKKTAKAAENSFAALEKELKDNESALKRMTMGTKEFAKQREKVDGLRDSVRTARGELGSMNGATRGIGAAATAGVASVAKMAVGLVGLNTVVTAITSELDKAAQLRIAAAQKGRSLEQVLADIAPNIGAQNLGMARDFIRQGAVDTGASQEGYANLIGNAISAGAKDLEEAGAVAAAALKLTAGREDKAQELAGGALDIAKLSGSQNFAGALGQISQIQSLVRATDAGLFARNIGGALASASAERQNIDAMSTEQAFERATVISQLTKDQTGAVTATGLRTYLGRLDRFAPQLEKTLKDKSVSTLTPELIAQFKGTRDVGQREALLRANPALRRQFIDDLEESESKSAIVELVSGTNRAMGILNQAEQVITDIDQAAGTYDELAQAITEQTGGLQARNRGEARREFVQTEGINGLLGQADEVFEKFLTGVDLPGLDEGRAKVERVRRQKSILAGEDRLEATLKALESASTPKGLFEMPLDRQGQLELESARQEIKDLQYQIFMFNQREAEKKVVVQGPPMRPKEVPLPAANIP